MRVEGPARQVRIWSYLFPIYKNQTKRLRRRPEGLGFKADPFPFGKMLAGMALVTSAPESMRPFSYACCNVMYYLKIFAHKSIFNNVPYPLISGMANNASLACPIVLSCWNQRNRVSVKCGSVIYYLPSGKITEKLPMQQYLKWLIYYISVMAGKSDTCSSGRAGQTVNLQQ